MKWKVLAVVGLVLLGLLVAVHAEKGITLSDAPDVDIPTVNESTTSNTTHETEVEVDVSTTVMHNETDTNVTHETSVSVETEVENETNVETETEVRPPKVKLPENVCASYIVNVTRARVLAREQFREKVGKELDMIRANTILAGMNIVIEKGEEYGANVSVLIELKNEFVEIMNSLNVSAGPEYRENAKLLIQIARQFRMEAHKIPELAEHSQEIKEAVKEAMKQEKMKHQEEIREGLELAKEVGLAVFDLHICLAQEKLNRFYNLGFNVTEAQEILDDIKDMRDDLEAAYDSGNRTEVAMVKVEIARMWGEFHRAFVRLNSKVMKYQFERAKEKLTQAMNKLQQMGVDTSKMQEKLEKLERMTKHLENESSLEEFNEKFNELNQEIKGKAKVKIPAIPKGPGGA